MIRDRVFFEYCGSNYSYDGKNFCIWRDGWVFVIDNGELMDRYIELIRKHRLGRFYEQVL